MAEPPTADPPSGKVPREWQKQGTWLSLAWEVFGPPSRVERAHRAVKKFSELREGETPEMHLMSSGVEFPQWRKARRIPRDEVAAVWAEYCINRAAAEMDIEEQLHFGSLSAFGAPQHRGAEPEWIPTQAWYGLHRDLNQNDVVRGEGIVYFYVRVIDADRSSKAAAQGRKRGRRPGKDYREADRPILELIQAGVADGTYKNITDGARNLAHKAIGSKEEESKVKRLISRFPAFQSGKY